jgi:hypothetical protein
MSGSGSLRDVGFGGGRSRDLADPGDEEEDDDEKAACGRQGAFGDAHGMSPAEKRSRATSGALEPSWEFLRR